MTPTYGESHGQSVARQVIARLTREQAAFNKVCDEQRTLVANMLAEDIGFQVDMVVDYDGELAIITDIYLDPRDINGTMFRIECYNDDQKHAVVTSDRVQKWEDKR